MNFVEFRTTALCSPEPEPRLKLDSVFEQKPCARRVATIGMDETGLTFESTLADAVQSRQFLEHLAKASFAKSARSMCSGSKLIFTFLAHEHREKAARHTSVVAFLDDVFSSSKKRKLEEQWSPRSSDSSSDTYERLAELAARPDFGESFALLLQRGVVVLGPAE